MSERASSRNCPRQARLQLSRLAPQEVFVIAKPQFNLPDDAYTLPDILVHPVSVETPCFSCSVAGIQNTKFSRIEAWCY